jgi:hypothetical protein
MSQPLVTRPAYGSPVGVSGLPGGGPSDKGLPVDPGIPGSATYAKPVGDTREQGKDDEPIKRVDDADDLTKERGRIDTREDNADKHDGIGFNGVGEQDNAKTKYPYRDGLPNTHNAAMVVGLFRLQTAPDLRIDLEDVRVAATLDQISSGLSKNMRWIFSVNAGNGPKLVRMKARRKATSIVALTKMDVHLSCSCPAWQWQGPEYHAQQGKYQDGKPVGTAATPNVRDPERVNRVCKHVAAVVKLVRAWKIPAKQAGADPFVLERCWEVLSEPGPPDDKWLAR